MTEISLETIRTFLESHKTLMMLVEDIGRERIEIKYKENELRDAAAKIKGVSS